ncbi:MAG: hypothetical protein ABFS86_14145 [Planctomycetota bacterium]
MKRLVILSLVAVIAVATGFAGFTYGIGMAPVKTSAGLVKVYSEHATTLLSVKETEELIVKEIIADAARQANHRLSLATHAVKADKRPAAAEYVESAAGAVALIANEGDKAVAAVRNRLLEGGHHHHATPEIAAKYDPGFVVVTKTAKNGLLAQAKALGQLAAAVKDGSAGEAEIAAAKNALAKAVMEVVK